MDNYGTAGRATDDNWHMRIACWIPKATQTHNRNMQYFLLFHGNNRHTKAPHCYVHIYIACIVYILFFLPFKPTQLKLTSYIHILLSKNLKIKTYRSINLSVVLYGCETWSLTLREERKLRVFENMVLRRIFGPRRDEVSGEWRRLHNEELNDLYSSPNIMWVIKSRRMRWAGNVARMDEESGVYRVLVGKPEGKRPLGRPRRRWEDNIRMDLQEVGCGYVDWIGLAQDRDRWRTLVSAVMNLRVP